MHKLLLALAALGAIFVCGGVLPFAVALLTGSVSLAGYGSFSILLGTVLLWLVFDRV